MLGTDCDIPVAGVAAIEEPGTRERRIEVRSTRAASITNAVTTAATTETTVGKWATCAGIAAAESASESERAEATVARGASTRGDGVSQTIAAGTQPPGATASVILAAIASAASAAIAVRPASTAARTETVGADCSVGRGCDSARSRIGGAAATTGDDEGRAAASHPNKRATTTAAAPNSAKVACRTGAADNDIQHGTGGQRSIAFNFRAATARGG